MQKKAISLLTAVAISTMAFSATPVNAVDTTSDENSMVISYTYENGTVEAVLSANGSVCIGGFEATLNYNNSANKVKEKTAVNSNILMNNISTKGELAVSMAANSNLTDESDLFKISFESAAKPNKSDFSFEITDMYMFNETLDSESAAYTISEKWSGFDEATTTTTQSTTTASTTTTTTTTEPKSADLSDNKFIVSIQENKESNAVEVSLSVEGKVEFWTVEGSVKLDMVGLDSPTMVNVIPDALTTYNEDANSILFTVVSSSGQNITEEQNIFTYSMPINSSEYRITCYPQIADICNADYQDAKYAMIVDDEIHPVSTTTITTATTTSATTKSSTQTSITASTTSTITAPTVSTTASQTTTESTSSIQKTTTSVTATTTATTSSTTKSSTQASTTASQTTIASTTSTPTTTTTPEPTETLPTGDPNNDSKVDSKDASFVLIEYSKLSTGQESDLSAAQKKAADVNGDGKVDSKDASAILAYYSYISTGGNDSMDRYLTEHKIRQTV